MENLQIVEPTSFKLWNMVMSNMVSTMACLDLLEKAEQLPARQPDTLPSANPLVNQKFDVGNVDLLVQIASEADLRFMDLHEAAIRKAHTAIVKFNASDDVAEFMLEAPRSYAEIDLLFSELWETQQSLDAIEFQFPAATVSETEAPLFLCLDEEKLSEMDSDALYMIAKNLKGMVSELCSENKQIGIIENGKMKFQIAADVLNERWMLYLENCELSFVMIENNDGKFVLNPAFKKMGSARDMMRFLEQMACVKLFNPEGFIIELFNFYALVVCGSYAQLLHTVNFREVQNDLDFEFVDEEFVDTFNVSETIELLH